MSLATFILQVALLFKSDAVTITGNYAWQPHIAMKQGNYLSRAVYIQTLILLPQTSK